VHQDELKISAGMTQSECEDVVAQLPRSRPNMLELPQRLESLRALGLESTYISLIVTWARAATIPTLMLPVSELGKDSYLSHLCQTAYGLTALTLAKVIKTNDGVEIPLKTIKDLVNKRLLEFDDKNLRILVHDEGVSLVSIYNHPREFGKWLYTQPNGVIGTGMLMPDQFGAWLGYLMKQIVPSEFSERLDENRLNSICSASYELLENAFNHGRLNKFAEPIRAGVCGLGIRAISVSQDDANLLSSGNGDVHLYFAQRILKDKTKEGLFLEITVFDSGIGYHEWINAPCNSGVATQRFRGKNEHITVQECILKHATSKRSDGSGVGLFRVLRLLKDLFGFIRIRTGKTCFYARLDLYEDGKPRALGAQAPAESNRQVKLKDWFPEKELPEANGTTVTLCIPLTHWRSPQ
jgi:hypothetical protein